MKEELCKAFCNDLKVSAVPAGIAVTTPFASADGDHIGFYVIKTGDDTFRIEDDGTILPYLEGSGVDFRSGTRGEALTELLREYGAAIDEQTQEFFIGNIAEANLPGAALKFVAFSLRVRDFDVVAKSPPQPKKKKAAAGKRLRGPNEPND